MPLYRSRRRWADRIKEIDVPLFQNHVFRQVTDAVVGRIVTTPGAIPSVGAGRTPIPVDPDEIDALERGTDAVIEIPIAVAG